MKPPDSSFLFRYRLSLGFFIIGLIASGLSAFPLPWELSILSKFSGVADPSNYAQLSGVQRWIAFVESGLRETYAHFPFFGYATDWLGFGHFVIAAFFILPFIDPARYRAVLQVGLIACGGVIILALICGPIRGIPFFWTLIDCSFGLIGAIPLLYCLRLTRKLER